MGVSVAHLSRPRDNATCVWTVTKHLDLIDTDDQFTTNHPDNSFARNYWSKISPCLIFYVIINMRSRQGDLSPISPTRDFLGSFTSLLVVFSNEVMN